MVCTSVETSSHMTLGDVATEVVPNTNRAIVRSLRCWIATSRPTQMGSLFHQRIFLGREVVVDVVVERLRSSHLFESISRTGGRGPVVGLGATETRVGGQRFAT